MTQIRENIPDSESGTFGLAKSNKLYMATAGETISTLHNCQSEVSRLYSTVDTVTYVLIIKLLVKLD